MDIQHLSRRQILVAGTLTGIGASLAMPRLTEPLMAATDPEKKKDLEVLNKALYYEHQAIWAYGFAGGKLSNTKVGKAVLNLALGNQSDHKKHRDALSGAISSLGGQPVTAQANYDLSSYIQKGEGNIDSDVNIAKLALALEIDAAIAYTTEVANLKTPALIMAGASIGSNESAHAAAIRATFQSLGVELEIVPTSFINTDNRQAWILKV